VLNGCAAVQERSHGCRQTKCSRHLSTWRLHAMISPFRYFNSSPEVIRLVVMMQARYPLSLRNVEDLLAERGIDISHETVRQRGGALSAVRPKTDRAFEGTVTRSVALLGSKRRMAHHALSRQEQPIHAAVSTRGFLGGSPSLLDHLAIELLSHSEAACETVSTRREGRPQRSVRCPMHKPKPPWRRQSSG